MHEKPYANDNEKPQAVEVGFGREAMLASLQLLTEALEGAPSIKPVSASELECFNTLVARNGWLTPHDLCGKVESYRNCLQDTRVHNARNVQLALLALKATLQKRVTSE